MRGYSLLEALVAISVLAVGVAALAHLTVLATHANVRARHTTVAAVLAQQKMEDLAPDAARGGAIASPAGTLDANAPSFFEFVDRDGNVLGGGAAPPAGSAYLRRWSMEPLPGDTGTTWLLQVLVRNLRDAGPGGAQSDGRRRPGDGRLVSAMAGRSF